MSRVEQLITELSPDGVPVVALKSVADTVPGLSGKTKEDFSDGNAQFVSYKNVYANLVIDQSAEDFVRISPGERQNRLHLGDVIFTGSSESVDEVGLSSVITSEPANPLYLNSFCFAVRFRDPNILEPDFSKHLFRSELMRAQIRRAASGVTRINLSKSRFLKIEVPIPPIEVQREIARILDKFIELQSCLGAELAARKEQRQALTRMLPNMASIQALSPRGLERVRIGELAKQSFDRVRVRADGTYTNLGVKWYGEGAFARGSKPGSSIKGSTLNRAKSGQFIYNRMFVVEGSFGVITADLDGGVVSNEFPLYDIDRTRLDPQWLKLYLLDEYTLKRIAAEVTGVERGTMKSRRRWKEDQFEAFQIDLPSLEAQKEILRILGAGEELECSLSDVANARQLQFAHYRESLMSFKRLDA